MTCDIDFIFISFYIHKTIEIKHSISFRKWKGSLLDLRDDECMDYIYEKFCEIEMSESNNRRHVSLVTENITPYPHNLLNKDIFHLLATTKEQV